MNRKNTRSKDTSLTLGDRFLDAQTELTYRVSKLNSTRVVIDENDINPPKNPLYRKSVHLTCETDPSISKLHAAIDSGTRRGREYKSFPVALMGHRKSLEFSQDYMSSLIQSKTMKRC